MNKEKLSRTEPINATDCQDAAHLTVASSWQDPRTKALYIHESLVRVQEPWAEESHISPMSVGEKFGDIESFAHYVARFGDPPTSHLTWNSRGLRAVLDYAHQDTNAPGRRQWTAELPFVTSAAWNVWMAVANGQALGQKSAVEKLEDLATDIIEPKPADLMGLLRSLRATVNAKADTELRPDGTTKVAFERDTRVATASAVDLPALFAISIPILKGHVNAEGLPVRYRLEVRLRVSVDDAAKLSLRFAIPGAERILEDVYAERVEAAKAALGETYSLLRGAD